MPMGGMAGASDGGGTLMAICTADGLIEVALDDDGSSAPTEQSSHGQGCLFCVAHPGFSLPPPVAPMVGQPVVCKVGAIAAFDFGFVPEAVFLTGHLPRGPPPSLA